MHTNHPQTQIASSFFPLPTSSGIVGGSPIKVKPCTLLATQSLGYLSGQVPFSQSGEEIQETWGAPNYEILLLQELHSFCSNQALL